MTVQNIICDEKDYFLYWYDNLVAALGGVKPKRIDNWFENVQKAHENIRSFLGNKLSLEVTRGKIRTKLSTRIEDLMLVGCYGVDNESCFRQGAFNQSKRFTFSVAQNTFVITMYDSTNDCIFRGLGFMDKSFAVMNVCGTYTRWEVKNASTMIEMHHLAIKMFGTQSVGYAKDKIVFNGGGLYSHPPYHSFCDKSRISEVPMQFLNAPDSYS